MIALISHFRCSQNEKLCLFHCLYPVCVGIYGVARTILFNYDFTHFTCNNTLKQEILIEKMLIIEFHLVFPFQNSSIAVFRNSLWTMVSQVDLFRNSTGLDF